MTEFEQRKSETNEGITPVQQAPTKPQMRPISPAPPPTWGRPRLGWWLGVMVGVVLLLVALGWLLTRAETSAVDGADEPTSMDRSSAALVVGKAGAGSNIAARHFDGANRPRLEHSSKPFELDAYRELIESDELVLLDDSSALEWLETRVALLDPVTAFAAEEDCRDRYADFGPGQVCAYRLAVVFEREGDRSRVVYARAGVDDSGDFAECSDFANCMAAARLGSYAATPGRAGERFAVGIDVSFSSNQDRLRDAEQIRDTIEVMEAMLERAREADLVDEDPGIAFRLTMHERLIEFWKLRLARLEAAA